MDFHQKVRRVIEMQFLAGKSSSEILKMGENAGISREIIETEMEKVRRKTFWDPTGDRVTLQSFRGHRVDLNTIFEKYQKNPHFPKIIFGICLFIAIIPISFGKFFGFLSNQIFYGEAIALLPAVFYWRHLSALRDDLINIFIAQKKRWAYNPARQESRYTALRRVFPEILKGDTFFKRHAISNEFWGNFAFETEKVDFWTAQIEERKHQNIDSNAIMPTMWYTRLFEKLILNALKNTKFQTVFAFRLKRKLKTRFLIAPEHFLEKVFRREKEIDLESAEFNKNFAIFYNGQKVEKQNEIVKILSPAVQLRLLEMKKVFGDFYILFVDDAIFFLFDGKLLQNPRTNFLKTTKINLIDVAVVENRLQKTFEIGVDIARFLR